MHHYFQRNNMLSDFHWVSTQGVCTVFIYMRKIQNDLLTLSFVLNSQVTYTMKTGVCKGSCHYIQLLKT